MDHAASFESVVVERAGTRILDGITGHIVAGRLTALLGPNGCGKTTLTRVLTGEIWATKGVVEVLGQRLGRVDVRTLRRRVVVVAGTIDRGAGHAVGSVVDGRLSTDLAVATGLFGTVGLYDRPSDAQLDRCRTLLHTVGLSHRLEHPVLALSTGELRRALIARALAAEPDLLILDEPTAGLDLAGRERLLATVDRLARDPAGPTILLITHHVEELPPSTRSVWLMRGGRIVAAGPPEAVITPESLSGLFGCRVDVQQRNGRWWLEVLPEAWLELGRSGAPKP